MDPTTKPKGQRVAYKRVSTLDQSTARQLDGMIFDREFVDKASGKDTARPALQETIAYLREGDRLIIHSMDRLCRNLGDLRQIVEELTSRGVAVEFIKEGMTFTGDDTPMAKFMLNIMGSFAELERAMILSRQQEGVALAKRCVTCGKTREEHRSQTHSFTSKYTGRAPAIRAANGKLEQLEKLHSQNAPVSEMARAAGVSRQTVYAWLKSRATAIKAEAVAA